MFPPYLVFPQAFCSLLVSFRSPLGLRIGAVRVVAPAWVLVELGGFGSGRVRRCDFILGGKMRCRLPFQIVDYGLNDGFARLGNCGEFAGCFLRLFAHGCSSFLFAILGNQAWSGAAAGAEVNEKGGNRAMGEE